MKGQERWNHDRPNMLFSQQEACNKNGHIGDNSMAAGERPTTATASDAERILSLPDLII
jgi:hypothetical protein